MAKGLSSLTHPRIIARATTITLLSAGVGALLLLYLNRSAYGGADLVSQALGLGGGLAYVMVGYVVVSRQPKNALCWILVAIGAIELLSGLANQWGIRALITAAGSLPAGIEMAWIAQWSSQLIPVGWGLAVLLFPNGNPPSPRWRPLIWLACTCAIIDAAGTALLNNIYPFGNYQGAPGQHFHNPFAFPHGEVIAGVGIVLSLAMLLVIVPGATVVRFRRSVGDEREQMKWLAFALLANLIIWAAILPLAKATAGDSHILTALYVVAPHVLEYGLLASIASAILKHRLYDIDIIISRTLVYGALAAFITAVYIGIVVGIGSLVGSGGNPNLALSIVATALVAVAFQPVRERLQKVANRVVYGKRATPYEVLSQFSERVAESYAADDVLPRMAQVLADGTGAARADVWLRAGDILRQVASWPTDSAAAEPARVVGESLPRMLDTDRTVEVRHQGELLGALTVTKRKGESLTPVEEKLLTDLAGQAGLVLKNVGLTAELLARLGDLRTSRQRLVAAQDEERRRLERNLHDGAQQNLVALKVKLGLAEMFADKDPVRAKQTLAELKVDTDEALETLRDLARGIYPPLLADKGLVAALESQARKATLPVQVEADGVLRYPQEVEAAVYFCCLEALQNVQKYAGAESAVVKLEGSDSGLRFEVTDDGHGFDNALVKRGAGLTNMTDRIDALGGSLELASTPGGGTQIRGSLPALAAAALA